MRPLAPRACRPPSPTLRPPSPPGQQQTRLTQRLLKRLVKQRLLNPAHACAAPIAGLPRGSAPGASAAAPGRRLPNIFVLSEQQLVELCLQRGLPLVCAGQLHYQLYTERVRAFDQMIKLPPLFVAWLVKSFRVGPDMLDRSCAQVAAAIASVTTAAEAAAVLAEAPVEATSAPLAFFGRDDLEARTNPASAGGTLARTNPGNVGVTLSSDAAALSPSESSSCHILACFGVELGTSWAVRDQAHCEHGNTW